MKASTAKYRMRLPRYTRSGKSGIMAGWYYIEDDGISVLCSAAKALEGATMVKLTWKQIEQALALRDASNG